MNNQDFLSLKDWRAFKLTYDRRLNYLDLFKTMFYVSDDLWSVKDKKWFCAKRLFASSKVYPNLNNPKRLTEWINYYKFHYKDPMMTYCVDKITFKEYVTKKVGSQYVTPLIGKYDDVFDINPSNLPDKFVIKSNCGSGSRSVIIVKDKKSFFEDQSVMKRLSDWLIPWNNVYYHTFDWAYKDINPQILVEEVIENKGYEYKVYVFGGGVKFLHVVNDPTKEVKPYLDFYDLDWNWISGTMFYQNFPQRVEKPKFFDEMIKVSEIIAKDFPFARVDFIESNGSLLLTEITFYPGSGLNAIMPISTDILLGRYFTEVSHLLK